MLRHNCVIPPTFFAVMVKWFQFKLMEAMMKENLVRFTLRIDKSMFDKLTYIAGCEVRSRNREIEQLIKHRIADFETEHGKIDV